MRESAIESGWLPPLLGAGIGALVVRAMRSRREGRPAERYYEPGWTRTSFPYEGELERGRYSPYGEERTGAGEGRLSQMRERAAEQVSGIKEQASGMKEQVAEKAGELKEQVSARAGEIKERVQEGVGAIRERLPERQAIRASLRDDTPLWALGAMGLGILFGFALPVTESERQVLGPARRKLREIGEQAKDIALEKGSAALDEASAAVQEKSPGGQPPSTSLH